MQASTTEYDQGTPSTTRAAFRSYDDASQSVGDYVSLLQTSPRYAGALGAGADVHAFANGLQRGGYATDATALPLRSGHEDKFPQSKADPPGLRAHGLHHIRKVNTRDSAPTRAVATPLHAGGCFESAFPSESPSRTDMLRRKTTLKKESVACSSSAFRRRLKINSNS